MLFIKIRRFKFHLNKWYKEHFIWPSIFRDIVDLEYPSFLRRLLCVCSLEITCHSCVYVNLRIRNRQLLNLKNKSRSKVLALVSFIIQSSACCEHLLFVSNAIRRSVLFLTKSQSHRVAVVSAIEWWKMYTKRKIGSYYKIESIQHNKAQTNAIFLILCQLNGYACTTWTRQCDFFRVTCCLLVCP